MPTMHIEQKNGNPLEIVSKMFKIIYNLFFAILFRADFCIFRALFTRKKIPSSIIRKKTLNTSIQKHIFIVFF